MERLARRGLLLLQVGASLGALAALEGGVARVLALFNSEVETAWRPPRPHWSGQLQAIGRRQRRHLTRCLNRAWGQKQGPLRLQNGRRWSGWPLRGQRVGEAQHPGPHAMLVDAGAMERERSPPRGGEQARVFCPVDGCPAANPRAARGWGSHAAGPTWTTMPLEPCRGRSRSLLCSPQLGPLSGMWPSACRSIQWGPPSVPACSRGLCSTCGGPASAALFLADRYFGMCPKSLVRRGPNALPSSGRSSAPQLGRSLVGPAHAPESRASTCTTWRGPTATASRTIHSSAVWAVAGR